MAAVVQRRFRFGVRHTGSTLEEWRRVARKAEDLGFSTLVVQDHVDRQLAPLLGSSAAAPPHMWKEQGQPARCVLSSWADRGSS